MSLADLVLTAVERGNGSTAIDRRHTGGAEWTEGSQVAVLVDGDEY